MLGEIPGLCREWGAAHGYRLKRGGSVNGIALLLRHLFIIYDHFNDNIQEKIVFENYLALLVFQYNDSFFVRVTRIFSRIFIISHWKMINTHLYKAFVKTQKVPQIEAILKRT